MRNNVIELTFDYWKRRYLIILIFANFSFYRNAIIYTGFF